MVYRQKMDMPVLPNVPLLLIVPVTVAALWQISGDASVPGAANITNSLRDVGMLGLMTWIARTLYQSNKELQQRLDKAAEDRAKDQERWHQHTVDLMAKHSTDNAARTAETMKVMTEGLAAVQEARRSNDEFAAALEQTGNRLEILADAVEKIKKG